jgi:predicted TIM-barrel fold metal-dependent hydrolase
VLLAACQAESTPPEVVPGEGIGELRLGMSWAEARELLGEPEPPLVLVGVAHVRWPSGVEALLTSPDESMLTDDALVVGLGTVTDRSRASIEADFGAPAEELAGCAYYPSGLAVEYAGDTARRAVVVAPYQLAPAPPPMAPARGARPATVVSPRPQLIVDGEAFEVIDMHLHPGDFATMATSGKAFVTGSLPPVLAPYAAELLDRFTDPYAPHVGIVAQLDLASIAHGVLYAVYTPRTTGYQSNERLEELLADPRNTGLFFGMASVDFDGWNDDLAGERLAALDSYLASPQFVGIKLAHAHQGVSFADPVYHGVFALAGERQVPVLLHTGFSPFPGSQDDPAYYDPLGLEPTILAHDGNHGLPRVDFVLSHVGQGDARAVEHALALAEAHDNVWLELSALGRPLRIDANGEPVAGGEPQLPGVLAAIKARGLTSRALFASDGPQSSGMVRSYLGKVVAGMQEAGFDRDEMAAVLAGNFRRLYLADSRRWTTR